MSTERTAAEERAANVALLRETADNASKRSVRWQQSAAAMETYGHHAAAEADRREASTNSRIAAALRAAANRIERGDHLR